MGWTLVLEAEDFAVMNDSGIGCGTGKTWPVGQKPMGMSIYGVHDLIGNVAEWTRPFDGDTSCPAR